MLNVEIKKVKKYKFKLSKFK